LDSGLRILLYRNAMIHAKTATIDGQWSTIGTANIDCLSLTGNYETILEIHDKGFAANMEDIFEVDSRNSYELTLEEWGTRPWVARFSESVIVPLRPSSSGCTSISVRWACSKPTTPSRKGEHRGPPVALLFELGAHTRFLRRAP
jgi:PLD-like domain